jgi:hypothetical protein
LQPERSCESVDFRLLLTHSRSSCLRLKCP